MVDARDEGRGIDRGREGRTLDVCRGIARRLRRGDRRRRGRWRDGRWRARNGRRGDRSLRGDGLRGAARPEAQRHHGDERSSSNGPPGRAPHGGTSTHCGGQPYAGCAAPSPRLRHSRAPEGFTASRWRSHLRQSRDVAATRPRAETEPAMAVEPAAKQMTSEEIVALNRAHTFFSWSVQGAARSDRDRSRRGRLPVHARGPADPRLQQPADVGEHRPRRPAGDRRDHRAGARSSSTSCPRSPRRSGGGSARSWPRSCPATSTRSSSRSAAPRRSRTRSSSPATTPAGTRSSPATAPTTAPRSGR